MKALLTALKSQVQTALTYVRALDVRVVPHVDVMPVGAKSPCIGLKDGPVQCVELAGGMMRWIMKVHLVVYVRLAKDEASVMGDVAASRKGVLDIADDLHENLDENLLSISGMESAYCPAETESELVTIDGDAFQRKILTYQYEKEGSRP